MTFGIPEALMLISAIGSTAGAMNRPDAPNMPAPPAGGVGSPAGSGPFALPVQGGGGAVADVIGAGAVSDDMLTQAAQNAAATVGGPPPTTVPLAAPQPGVPVGGVGPPAPANDPHAQPAPPQPANIGEVLAASPQAIAAMAQLLGLGGPAPVGARPAPVPGGTAGRVVQGFTQPPPSIGALLSQIPRIQ